jgi:hypothetical protein
LSSDLYSNCRGSGSIADDVLVAACLVDGPVVPGDQHGAVPGGLPSPHRPRGNRESTRRTLAVVQWLTDDHPAAVASLEKALRFHTDAGDTGRDAGRRDAGVHRRLANVGAPEAAAAAEQLAGLKA